MTAELPFVYQPATDTAAARRAAGRALEQWGVERELEFLRRGMNVLFRAGTAVIRVGRASAPAVTSHEMVRNLGRHNIPTVEPVAGWAVDIEGFAVTGWVAVTEIERSPSWEQVGAAVRAVHDLEYPLGHPHLGGAESGGGYPIPSPTVFPWWDFEAMLSDTAADIDTAARRGIEKTLGLHAGWRSQVTSDAVVCHGDVHPGNVMVSDRGSLLIDWDLMCVANPAWDHAMLLSAHARWGQPDGIYERFAAGYGISFVDDELAVALSELRNVAATLMKVRAARHTRSAVAEAERRLRYWRGDSNAPSWRAQ